VSCANVVKILEGRKVDPKPVYDKYGEMEEWPKLLFTKNKVFSIDLKKTGRKIEDEKQRTEEERFKDEKEKRRIMRDMEYENEKEKRQTKAKTKRNSNRRQTKKGKRERKEQNFINTLLNTKRKREGNYKRKANNCKE